jgi:hypothetical protein
MNQTGLTDILAKHKLWREGDSSGARANLAGADLAGADLAGADLAGADLARANLAGADLADADLARANLAGADLARANLAGADLARANLARANLADANLAGANLAGANLAGADLAGADLADADLADARNVPTGIEKKDPPEPYKRATGPTDYAARAAHYRELHPNVPIVENLDKRILGVIESGVGKLDMSQWHSCETTHCRAGWAIHLAGERGYALEREYSSQTAGRMIYLASTGRSAHFFASNERALEDLRRRAAESAQVSGTES